MVVRRDGQYLDTRIASGIPIYFGIGIDFFAFFVLLMPTIMVILFIYLILAGVTHSHLSVMSRLSISIQLAVPASLIKQKCEQQ